MHQGKFVTFTNKDPCFNNLRWVLQARSREEEALTGRYALESINFYPDGWIVCTDGWRLHATFFNKTLITGLYDITLNTEKEITLTEVSDRHYIKNWFNAFPAPKQPTPEVEINTNNKELQMYFLMQFFCKHDTCVNYKFVESVLDGEKYETWKVILTDRSNSPEFIGDTVCFWNEKRNQFAGIMSMRY